MTAEQFVEKWSRADLSERAASHEHFIDLCIPWRRAGERSINSS
jgi:hypothetical protein